LNEITRQQIGTRQSMKSNDKISIKSSGSSNPFYVGATLLNKNENKGNEKNEKSKREDKLYGNSIGLRNSDSNITRPGILINLRRKRREEEGEGEGEKEEQKKEKEREKKKRRRRRRRRKKKRRRRRRGRKAYNQCRKCY
jgi:hypothetical protein